MRTAMTCLFGLLAVQSAYSQRGGGYYSNDIVTITGPASWGNVQPYATYHNSYTVSSSQTLLTAVGIGGDAEFTLSAPVCVGAKSCVAIVSFAPAYGGDYTATLSASGASGNRIRAGSRAETVTAHVLGANYTLAAGPVVSNGNGDNPLITATFTIASTGEADLHLSGVTVTDGYGRNAATAASNTCVGTIAKGTTCKIVVSYVPLVGDDAGFYSISVAVTGDTRRQPPVTIGGSALFF